MNVLYPDYDNSLLALIASVLRHYGVNTGHPTLPALDAALAKDHQNVVLLLLDGLGQDALIRHLPEDSFLRRHQQGTLSSVFPPTTTAATTTLGTGASPVEHGWLGWGLYFPEVGQVVEIFRNTVQDSGGRMAADYPVAPRYLPLSPVFEAITTAGRARANSVSPFGDIRIRGMEELFTTLKELCGDDERRYLYGYSLEPDATMHITGCFSSQTGAVIRELDRRVEQFCDGLKDTLLIIVADHGLLDVRYKFVIDHPELFSMLSRPLSIESRAASFGVKPEYKDAFPEEFHKAFGDDFLLLSREEVIQKGLFGPGKENPRLRELLGDYLAIAVNDVCLSQEPDVPSKKFRAAHAGMTESEMIVPLILVET